MVRKWWPRPAHYLEVWEAMRRFTATRQEHTRDEIWLVEHPPVYTLGQAGRPEHILNRGNIDVVKCDRGGQVTYHGPGQVLAYCLVDLRRLNLFVKEYVVLLENVVIQVLGELGVAGACLKPGAPGVYVPVAAHGATGAEDWGQAAPQTLCKVPAAKQLAKIAALGIKVSHGCAYHGLALNVDMDLAPFQGINPCGYAGMQTVDLRYCGIEADVSQIGDLLAQRLAEAFARLENTQTIATL